MADFVGRDRELSQLDKFLRRVIDGVGAQEPGVCVLLRGRRRVGKSRLLEQFLGIAARPSLFFTASRQGPDEVDLFVADVAASTLPGAGNAAGVTADGWGAALRLLAGALPDDEASIVVIDEFPYLVEDDESTEAAFQKSWDRVLSKKPVLLILVGSDLAMMEQLNSYGRPFHHRGTEMVVPPLTPAETGSVVGSPTAADAFDAYVVTGGLPLICQEWPAGIGLFEYLDEALHDPTSALIVSGERALRAEFPDDALAYDVLRRIGSGEMTFSNIGRAAGGLQAMSLNRALDLLTTKRIVAKDLPLSSKVSKEARYRVTDPYLRFWLTFIGPGMPLIERGRGGVVVDRVRTSWPDWRGRAIEPVLREGLARKLPLSFAPGAVEVGGYWTRSNRPEIDLIGADQSPVAKSVEFAGTIKWWDNRTVGQAEYNKLAGEIPEVPGASAATPLVVVARGAVHVNGAAAVFGPDDLLW